MYSHRIHGDNCNIQKDGTCVKEQPALIHRDWSALLYLNRCDYCAISLLLSPHPIQIPLSRFPSPQQPHPLFPSLYTRTIILSQLPSLLPSPISFLFPMISFPLPPSPLHTLLSAPPTSSVPRTAAKTAPPVARQVVESL